jgi:hypothetical protein
VKERGFGLSRARLTFFAESSRWPRKASSAIGRLRVNVPRDHARGAMIRCRELVPGARRALAWAPVAVPPHPAPLAPPALLRFASDDVGEAPRSWWKL